ncbi:22904_t:CDS:2 [Dentiscutata erythropus]|uniref:22904_t:CDS:1 n=1 Tax=Dentiscutata erythropus TaxID=1348616 RepID=A0A9N8YQX4_9GLOM|nr:22904_t:CDS:2 [Dentiscutata erythropus]
MSKEYGSTENDNKKTLSEYSEQLEKHSEKYGAQKYDYLQFNILSIIGYGGSAIVYSATFQEEKEKYALKSLNNNLILNYKSFKKLAREVIVGHLIVKVRHLAFN